MAKALKEPDGSSRDLALAYLATRPGDIRGCARYLGISQGFVRRWWIEAQKSGREIEAGIASRPMPPDELVEEVDDPEMPALFVPAPDVWEWAVRVFTEDSSPLYNAEHGHLADVRVGVLWTNEAFFRQGRHVVGLAEIPRITGHRWLKGARDRQLWDWFGFLPEFLITLDASYAAQASDASWCALLEHEMTHGAPDEDMYGAPRFDREGRPMIKLRGHDCEEFVSIVRRYGAGAAAGETARLVEAAMRAPLITEADIAAVCGTCIR